MASVEWDLVGPRELNVVTPSSLRASVPNVFAAPTVITDGSLPGAWIAPYIFCPAAFLPLLPAAATTTIPASTSFRAARQTGSLRHESSAGVPRLRLTTLIFCAARLV